MSHLGFRPVNPSERVVRRVHEPSFLDVAHVGPSEMRHGHSGGRKCIRSGVVRVAIVVFLLLGQLCVFQVWSCAVGVLATVALFMVKRDLFFTPSLPASPRDEVAMNTPSRTREYFATEIHDRIGHQLTLANLRVQQIASTFLRDDPEAEAGLAAAANSIDLALQEMYAIIDEIFDISYPAVREVNMNATLRSLADRIVSAGLNVDLTIDSLVTRLRRILLSSPRRWPRKA